MKIQNRMRGFGFNIKFVIRRSFLLLKNRLKYGKLYFNNVYWVDPQELCFISKDRNIWHNYLQIEDGDWDVPKMLFNDSNMYKAFKQRFDKGKEWKDTKHYQIMLKNVNNESMKWFFNTKEKLDKEFKRIELLYYEIKNNGYKTQKELNGNLIRLAIRRSLNEISVDISRNGKFLVNHGKHRLAIAKLLNLSLVPVVIIRRHKEWMELRKSHESLSHLDNIILSDNCYREATSNEITYRENVYDFYHKEGLKILKKGIRGDDK